MASINWNHPDIAKLPQEKIIVLKKITDDLSTMSKGESLSYIIALNSKLKEENITFSKEEYSILLSAVSGKLPAFFSQK